MAKLLANAADLYRAERYQGSSANLTSIRAGFTNLRPSGSAVDAYFQNEAQTSMRTSFRTDDSSDSSR